MQEKDQRDADDHVVQHGRGRNVDQFLAIVDALDANTHWQDAAIVDALDLLLDTLDRRHAFLAAPHQNDALYDVVVVVLAGDAKPRLVRRDDGCHIADDHRYARHLGQHGVADFIERADQPDATDDRDLRADVDRAAADVDVAVGQRLQHLRQRDAVGDELVDVDLQLIRLGLAAPAGDVDDARHRTEAALQHPILQGLEFEHGVARRADKLVAIDFADRADRGNLRLRVVQQRRKLREAVQDLLKRLFIGVVEGELQLHVRQAIQGNRADLIEIAQRRSLRLDRNGDVALDLFRREPGALGDDVHHRRGGVRIRLDVELPEGQKPADKRHHEERQHKHPLLDGKRNQRIQRSEPGTKRCEIRV